MRSTAINCYQMITILCAQLRLNDRNLLRSTAIKWSQSFALNCDQLRSTAINCDHNLLHPTAINCDQLRSTAINCDQMRSTAINCDHNLLHKTAIYLFYLFIYFSSLKRVARVSISWFSSGPFKIQHIKLYNISN